jgi:hypothetical protein
MANSGVADQYDYGSFHLYAMISGSETSLSTAKNIWELL